MTKIFLERGITLAKILMKSEQGKFNLVDLDFMHEIIDTLRKLEKDKEVRFVIIKGIGNFGAGADINELRRANETREYAQTFFSTMLEMFRTFFTFPKVIIANVEGIAYGASMEMLLASDFVIASENAKFAAPGAKIGVYPPVLITLGKYKLGFNTVTRLALLGEELDAETAKEVGLVNRISNNFDEANHELLEKLKLMAPSSVTVIRSLLYKEYEKQLENAFNELIDQVLTEDAKEGISSFLTKLKPKWSLSKF